MNTPCWIRILASDETRPGREGQEHRDAVLRFTGTGDEWLRTISLLKRTDMGIVTGRNSLGANREELLEMITFGPDEDEDANEYNWRMFLRAYYMLDYRLAKNRRGWAGISGITLVVCKQIIEGRAKIWATGTVEWEFSQKKEYQL